MHDGAKLLMAWLALVNAVGFLLMGADKRKAVRGAWRIAERTLFLAALLGGTPGVIAGMRAFRHKTRHWQFRYGLPVLLALQVAAAVFVLRSFPVL